MALGYTKDEVIGKMTCADLCRTPLCNTVDCTIKKCINTKKNVTGSTIAITKTGNIISIRAACGVLLDADGNPTGGFEVISDLTQVDEGFLNIVYDHIEVPEDTNYSVENLENATKYYFRVSSYNSALTSNYSDTQSVSTLGVSIDEKYLSNEITVFPNPFSSHTTLCYTLAKPENVQFTVYNVQSQIVYMMQEKQETGKQKLQWNAEGLPAGIYYYSIQAGDMIGSGKMVVLD